MMDDGVIKFDISWEKGDAPQHEHLVDLLSCRDRMFDMGLIGFDEKYQVGYGNISLKQAKGKGFIISGTQTGHLEKLGVAHYTAVVNYNIDQNALHCNGPVKASSESLTHAAIYEADDTIKAIIHIHHNTQWAHLLNKVPTTDKAVPYGTPQMAYEIKRLFADGHVKHGDIIAMAGHQGGLITFGKTMEEAAEPYLDLFSH